MIRACTERSLLIGLEFKSCLEAQLLQVNPQHPWHRAAEYTLSAWECLVAYVLDRAPDIDKNVAERSPRGIALSRKDLNVHRE